MRFEVRHEAFTSHTPIGGGTDQADTPAEFMSPYTEVLVTLYNWAFVRRTVVIGHKQIERRNLQQQN